MLARSRKIICGCVGHYTSNWNNCFISTKQSSKSNFRSADVLLKVDSKVIINFIKLARYKSRYHKEVGRQMSHTVLLKGRRERNE